jgi:ssDNA-binding Zn-finger/Zn-ribbon topoisomerase 1
MSHKADRHCDGCGADLRGAPIPENNLHLYNSYPDGTLIHSAEEYAKVRDQIENETTHFSEVIGVEYTYTSPEHYDGVSEWLCPNCGRREGRWTGKVLADGEFEKRFGDIDL